MTLPGLPWCYDSIIWTTLLKSAALFSGNCLSKLWTNGYIRYFSKIWVVWLSYAGFRLTCHSPLCRYATWSSLAVSELQLSAATPFWPYHWAASLPSWIEFNCLRSAVMGKVARLSIYWNDAACRLVIPLRQAALAQWYKNNHQSSNAARGKLVWKQHYSKNHLFLLFTGVVLQSVYQREYLAVIALG